MTEICDSVIAAACLLTMNGEEVKETATCRVTPNEEGHMKPDEGEIVATKNNDMDNEKEKCYWSAATPIPSCGQQQLADEAIHLPQMASSCATDTDSCNLTVQDTKRNTAKSCTTAATLKPPILFGSKNENEGVGAQKQPPTTNVAIHKNVSEVVVATTEDNSTDLKGPSIQDFNTYSGDQRSLATINMSYDDKCTTTNGTLICLSSDNVINKISTTNVITNDARHSFENTNPSNLTKQQQPIVSERGSQLTANCIDRSSTNAHDVDHDVTSISTPRSNMIDVHEPTTTTPGTEEVVTIKESASVCNEHSGGEKLPETTDESIEAEADASYNSAIVSVTSDDTTGFIQCIAEDDNSYETPISVGSVAVPETKCAPFESLLSGDLEEDIQECSDNPHQQSSHFDVTHDSFTDNLVNSFQTTEAHVKPPGLQTDLKEDIATLRDVSSKPAADGEFGGADITVFDEYELPPETVTGLAPPPQTLRSVLENDRTGDGGAMTGLQLQKMFELEDEYNNAPSTTAALTGLEGPQEMLPSALEHYAPFSTVPSSDPGSQKKKKKESAFEACAAPFATVGDLAPPPPQKMSTLENRQYVPCSTITDGLVPRKTSPTVEKHITCTEEVVELVVSSKHLTMLPEECAPQSTIPTCSTKMEQQLAIPEKATASVVTSPPAAAAAAVAHEKEELITEESLKESTCLIGDAIRNTTTNIIKEDSSSRPPKRIKFQEEVTYIEETTVHGMSDSSLSPEYNDDDQQLTVRSPYSIASNEIEVATTLKSGGVERKARHNKTVTSSSNLLKESSYPPTESIAEDTAPDSTNREKGVDFDKHGTVFHHSSNSSEVSIYQDGIDNSVATEPPPPPPGYITSTTSVLNTNEKLNKAQYTIKDLRNSLAVEKRKRILLAAALSEEARSEAERTFDDDTIKVAKMREEFEAEKSKWGSGAEQGRTKYEDQNENQEGIQQFVNDVQRQCENEVQNESEDLRRKWANENEYRNIEEIIRAEFAQRKDLLVLTQAMASEMADSQQRSLNCLREEMRNEMRNEVVHFKEEIRKEVEAGLKLDQEKAVLLAETRLAGEAENLRQELRVAHLKCKELESQCRDIENSRIKFGDTKQAYDKLSNRLSILEAKHRDTIDELAATKTLAENYRHQLKEMADELTAAKTSAEKYRHQIQMAKEELVQLQQNQEAHSAVMGELTGLRAQNGLMASSLSRERENSHSLQIKLDNALEQSRSLRQKLVKYKKKEEDSNAAASILVSDQLSPLAVEARTDQNLPGTANFGGSSLGSDGPSPHYAMNGNRDGEMGGAMPVFVQGSEHSPARFPARETQGHPPRMVKHESQEACTVPSSMSQTFGNEFGQQVLGNSTAFTGALTASAATQAISTPQQQAAYLDPYSSLSSNRAPKRETSTTREGLHPFSPQRVTRPRKQLPQQPQPQNVARQALMSHQKMGSTTTTTSATPLSVHQMTDTYTGGQQETTHHHHLAAPAATVHNPYQLR